MQSIVHVYIFAKCNCVLCVSSLYYTGTCLAIATRIHSNALSEWIVCKLSGTMAIHRFFSSVRRVLCWTLWGAHWLIRQMCDRHSEWAIGCELGDCLAFYVGDAPHTSIHRKTVAGCHFIDPVWLVGWLVLVHIFRQDEPTTDSSDAQLTWTFIQTSSTRWVNNVNDGGGNGKICCCCWCFSLSELDWQRDK